MIRNSSDNYSLYSMPVPPAPSRVTLTVNLAEPMATSIVAEASLSSVFLFVISPLLDTEQTVSPVFTVHVTVSLFGFEILICSVPALATV